MSMVTLIASMEGLCYLLSMMLMRILLKNEDLVEVKHISDDVLDLVDHVELVPSLQN